MSERIVPRVREVAARTRVLIEDFKREGISDSEMAIGMLLAVQAMPVVKALADNPQVGALLGKLERFAKAGLDLFDAGKLAK